MFFIIARMLERRPFRLGLFKSFGISHKDAPFHYCGKAPTETNSAYTTFTSPMINLTFPVMDSFWRECRPRKRIKPFV